MSELVYTVPLTRGMVRGNDRLPSRTRDFAAMTLLDVTFLDVTFLDIAFLDRRSRT